MLKTGLGAGLKPAVATQAVVYSLLFGVQEGVHSRLATVWGCTQREQCEHGQYGEHSRTVWTAALAGSVTGVLITPITTPLEVLKVVQRPARAYRPPVTVYCSLCTPNNDGVTNSLSI
jgi:hypothetical protein